MAVGSEKCENCGAVIGALEPAYVYRNHPVCQACAKKLGALASPWRRYGVLAGGIVVAAAVCILIASLRPNRDVAVATPVNPPAQAESKSPVVAEEIHPSLPTFGKWKLTTDVSPMDDKNNVFLSLDANETISGWMVEQRPVLQVSFQRGRWHVSIWTGMKPSWGGASDFTLGAVRFGKSPAQQSVFMLDGDQKWLRFNGPRLEVERLAQSQQLAVQFTPFNANLATMTFDLNGLPEALESTKSDTDWGQAASSTTEPSVIQQLRSRNQPPTTRPLSPRARGGLR